MRDCQLFSNQLLEWLYQSFAKNLSLGQQEEQEQFQQTYTASGFKQMGCGEGQACIIETINPGHILKKEQQIQGYMQETVLMVISRGQMCPPKGYNHILFGKRCWWSINYNATSCKCNSCKCYKSKCHSINFSHFYLPIATWRIMPDDMQSIATYQGHAAVHD